MSESIIAREITAVQQNSEQHVSLAFLFLTFLKIGSLAFGGYMALIAVNSS